ncbi:MAG: hypothetical protein P8R54_19510 [Myxococcota bacterium]|nr:hypothetical protein [Myxococcota bacterium]
MRDRTVLILIGLLLIVPIFGQAIPILNTHFLGIEYVDHYGTQWFYWFVEQQAGNEGSDHTDLFFYPWGKDIFAHTGTNVLDAWMAVPFRRLFGDILGYNIFLLFMLTLTGLAFIPLAREVTDNRLAIGVSTLLFSLSPYILFEAEEGRPTQAILLFVVLFFLFTLRTARQTGWKAPVLAGVMLALSGYQYWYYAFFGGMVCLAHGLWHTVRPREDAGGRWATLLRHALIALVALAVTLPGGWRLISMTTGADAEVPGLLDVDLWNLTTNPPVTREALTIGLQLWQPLRPWAGFFVQDPDGTERFLEHAVVMPWMMLPLMALAIWRPQKMSRGAFIAMIATAIVIATGPMLLVGEYILPNPLFIGLIKSIGFLQRLWWPGRAVAMLVILLGMAIAAVIASLAHRRRLQLAAVAVLTLLWGGELFRGKLLPFSAWDGTIPAGYRCLATGPEGAIIELPYAWTQAHLYYQTTHGRSILGGMLENNSTFTPTEFNEFIEGNELLNILLLSRLERAEFTHAAGDLEVIHELGYRYVLLQKDAFHALTNHSGLKDNAMRTRLRNMKKQLRNVLGEPVYDDARVSIFAPWGDPSPCAENAPEPDTKVVGQTEITVDARLVRHPDQQVVHRIWASSPAAQEAPLSLPQPVPPED